MDKLLKLSPKPQQGITKSEDRPHKLKLRPGGSTPAKTNHRVISKLKKGSKDTRGMQAEAISRVGKITEEELQQKEFDTLMQAEAAKTQIIVAFVLDFTASTINDVADFRKDVESFKKQLEEEFKKGITAHPVIARGTRYGGCNNDPEVIVGDTNRLELFNKTENIGWRGETPVGYGIEAVHKHFKNTDGPIVKAVIAMSDSDFEQPRNYEEVNQSFIKNGVVVASLVTTHSENEIKTHKEAITAPLGELGIVVDRTDPEINALQLIMEIITNIRDNMFRTKVAKQVQQNAAKRKATVSNTVNQQSKKVSLARQLKLKGRSKTAEKVFQGTKAHGLLE